jgi:hypothetical protein
MNNLSESSRGNYHPPVAARKAKSGWGGRRPGAGRKPILKDPVTVTNDIERADIEVLEAIAEERDVSVASLIRKAVTTYVKRHRRK